MPNHVHLILVPRDSGGIGRAMSAVHGRYAGRIHARLKRTGHFWQGRFGCVAMDEPHLGAAVRYLALGNTGTVYIIDGDPGFSFRHSMTSDGGELG